jgi:hypothetical protein
MERNTRIILFAQMLFDKKKKRNCMENLGLAVAQNWYPTLFFGLTAHHFAS